MFDWQKTDAVWVPQPLQRQMTQTPAAFDADDTGLLGIIVRAGSIDFGFVETFGFTRNATKQTLYSRRTAVRQPVKVRTTEVGVQITWSTHSFKRQSIIDAWNGSAAGISGGVLTSPLVIEMPGEEGEPGLKIDVPSADIEGNGIEGTFAESFMQLSFTASATLAEGSATLAKLELLGAAAGGE